MDKSVLWVAALSAVLAAAIGWQIGSGVNLRVALAAGLLIAGGVLGFRSPSLAIWSLLVWLPFMGLVRRLLLLTPTGEWLRLDPLLLVGPVTTVCVAAGILIRDPGLLGRTALAKWLVALLVMEVVQVANPLQPSLLVGAASLMFVLIPSLWFFLGHWAHERMRPGRMFVVMIAVAVAAAGYASFQILVGFGEFERIWIESRGYAALRVGGAIRPVSFFMSGSEFTSYLGVGLALAGVVVARRKIGIALLGLGLAGAMVYGLLLSASRGALVVGLVTFLVAVIRSSWKEARAWIVGAAVVAGVAYAFSQGERIIEAAPNDPARALMQHQVRGLSDPLNPKVSTAPTHLRMVVDAFRFALDEAPLGVGTGAMGLSAGKFGGGGAASEMEISDAFVAFGLPGGVLYLVVTWLALRACWRASNWGGWLWGAGAFAIAAGSFGNWTRGVHYSVAPLIWFVIGLADSVAHRQAAESRSPPASAATRPPEKPSGNALPKPPPGPTISGRGGAGPGRIAR